MYRNEANIWFDLYSIINENAIRNLIYDLNNIAIEINKKKRA